MNKLQIAKYLFLAVIILIVLAVLIQKCGHQIRENKTEKQENIKVVENTARIDSLEAVANTLQSELYKAHVKDSLAKIAANRLISYWKSKALSSRAKVDTIVNSNPDLKEAFDDSDSLLAVTEARNRELEKEKVRQWNDFNKVLSITEEQLQLQKETTAIISEQRDRYKKKSEKRFIVGPSVTFTYELKPTIGISLTYRVFRF